MRNFWFLRMSKTSTCENEFIFVISFSLSEGKEKCVAIVRILKIFLLKGKAKCFVIVLSKSCLDSY